MVLPFHPPRYIWMDIVVLSIPAHTLSLPYPSYPATYNFYVVYFYARALRRVCARVRFDTRTFFFFALFLAFYITEVDMACFRALPYLPVRFVRCFAARVRLRARVIGEFQHYARHHHRYRRALLRSGYFVAVAVPA